jgi:hypothetical protein
MGNIKFLRCFITYFFVFFLIGTAYSQECFTNHDCPDVNMNCVHHQCEKSIYPSKTSDSNINEDIQRLIDKRAKQKMESEPRDYFDTNTGRMIHCQDGHCN